MSQEPSTPIKSIAASLSLLVALQAPALAAGRAIAPIVVRTAPTPITFTGPAPILTPGTNLSALTPSLGLTPAISLTPALSPIILPSGAVAAPVILTPSLPASPFSVISGMAQGITGQVIKAIDAVGAINNAGSESASGLGGNLQRLLMGDKSSDLPPSSATPGSSSPNNSGLTPAAPQTPTQTLMLRTLEQVASVYLQHYAPIEWKQKQLGVNLKAEYHKARAKVLAKPDIKQAEFQTILADFVGATRDYHAGVQFATTERATLPLTIRSAGGRYYIAAVDREKLPEAAFPYQPGDEVVEFGGQSVGQAVAALSPVANVAETDARLSEMRLTSRSRKSGGVIPTGDIALKIKTQDGAVHDAKLAWDYKEEMIPQDSPVRDGGLGTQNADEWQFPTTDSVAKEAFRKVLRRFIPNMLSPKGGATDKADNGFAIGGKKSFVPALGEVLWETPPELADKLPFKAAIYKNAKGQRIGYVRISDYMGDEQGAALFAKVIAMFQKKTDGLVFDQVNNPGGSLFYMYSLLSMLTDKPLDVPKHRMIIDENEAAWAADVLQQLDPAKTHETETSVLREEMAGLEGDEAETMAGVGRYAQFIIDELKAGRRLTNPTALFGMDKIQPSTAVRYTKPLVVLVNELDFSCADFFPAILQDNKRATIFGVRTSGAGGAVKSVEFPNQQGVSGFSYTWTFAERPGGWPIENLGVTPDVRYEITAQDLRSGFSGYAKALDDTLSAMIEAAPQPVKVALAKDARVPQEGWDRAVKAMAAEGHELEPAMAADLIAAFALPDGSTLKVLDKKGHQLISYGTKEAAEGYLMLAGDTLFWLSPQGEAIMGAVLGPEGLQERPLAELAEEFQGEADFWAAQGQTKAPTGLAGMALFGASLSAADPTMLLVAAVGIGLMAYNIVLAVRGYFGIKRSEERFNGFLKATAAIERNRKALMRKMPGALEAVARQTDGAWKITVYFKNQASLAAAQTALSRGVEGFPLRGEVATPEAILDLIKNELPKA